jgi:protein required for attachment to host cells
MENGTWIVVADASRARIFSHHRDLRPSLVDALDHDLVATRPTRREPGGDRAVHTPAMVKPLRHAASLGLGAHRRRAEIDLARTVGSKLEHARALGLERVVLVAPPRTLGDLRQACTDDVRALISEEIDRDLTRMSVHEIDAYLRDVLH